MTFVLAHSLLGEPSAPKLAFFLHGALGAGNNLRSLAQKVLAGRPDYRAALVDLRHHGASQGAPPPNTLASCAADLQALGAELGRAPDVIIGHSFGGKTGLAYAAGRPSSLRQLWVLDSNPGPQEPSPNHEVLRVVAAVRRTHTPTADRATVVAELAAQGLSSGTANWLATNLERRAGGADFDWRFDLAAIEELMLDYFTVDLWPFLESSARTPDVHMVVAENSDRWAPENRERLSLLRDVPATTLSVVPNAGHWLHVDNPAFLIDLLQRGLV